MPVIQFLLRVVAAENLDEAEKAAKELNIQATDDQVASFWRGAAWARNAPNPYLVTPLKEILDNEIYARGIMDPIRFDVESGRTIQILRGDSMVTVTVGGENGPTPLSRLSETLDRRFRLRLSSWIPDDFKIALHDVVLKRLKPSLVYDETASAAGLEERRQELRLRLQTIGLNALMVTRGSIITPNILDMLQEEERVFQEKQDRSLAAVRFVGNFLLFAGIALSMVIFFRVAERDRIGFPYSRLFVVAAFCLLVVWSGYLLVLHEIPGTMLPIGLMLGIITLGTNTRSAIFLAAITSICGLILFDGRADIMMGHLGAGLFFVSAAARCRRRMPLLLVSAGSGLIGAVAFVAWNFARGNLQNLFSIAASLSLSRDDTVNPIVAAGGFVLNWSICGMLVILLIPVAERCFRVTTRIALQDLLASEHPLLKRLIVEAPGTFHHCTIVATLAEAAAAAIGADTLRARVGGLFHDIGKLKKPEYFTENEFGVSRHERLNPYMSALLIINHVLDGAEMARAIGLPYVVADMALQHHGDSLMKFFYYKACQQVPPGTVVAKESFLYPGPKPQTREAGVL
ncbi:MAG: HDIG domain-containing protein, partial [Planctomycetota bacterium]|nr:HDIG domain-containing protein [Planctomycetota bacterium]